MEDHIRFRGGKKPGGVDGFASPHIPGVPENEPDDAVNDSFGSIHPADTMDTEPEDDPEAGDKENRERSES